MARSGSLGVGLEEVDANKQIFFEFLLHSDEGSIWRGCATGEFLSSVSGVNFER